MIGIWVGLALIVFVALYFVLWVFPSSMEKVFLAPKQPQQEIKQLELSEIKWRDFKKYLVDSDYSVLGGKEHEQRLYLAYLDAKMSDNERSEIYIENNILFNWIKVVKTQILVDALSECYVEGIAAHLRKEYDLPLTEESYLDDLKLVVSKAKRYKIEYDRYEQEKLLLINAKGADEAKVGYDYYVDIDIAISKMQGYLLPPDVDTMTWCRLYRDLVNRIDKSKLHDGTKNIN